MKKIFEYFEKYPVIIVFLLSLLPLYPLLHEGMFTGHDSESHVARLVAFYQSLSEGNLVPRWAGGLNMGFGHPVLMFLYPMSNYLGSLVHFLGFGFADSVKSVFAACFILSGLFMYLFAKEVFGKKAGLIAAALYLFAPYRFVDMYVRAALGEHIAFMFMPLVLYSFYKLIKVQSYKYQVISSFSLAFLILSHNAVSLMFVPFLLLFLVVIIFYEKNKLNAIRYSLTAFTMGFMLSAFFWVPALLEGKYTLRDVLTVSEYTGNFPAFLSLFYSSWSFGGSRELSKQVGITNWIAVAASIFFIIKSRKNDTGKVLIIISLIGFSVAFLLLNRFSEPVWRHITLLQKFQFPWRLLTMSVLTSSVLGTSLLFAGKKQWLITVCIVALTLVISVPFWRVQGYLKYDDTYYIYNYRGTTDTGESSPKWSIRGMEYRPGKKIELIGGKGSVKESFRNTTAHVYKVTAETEIQLLDNTVYFPGWKAYADGVETPIQYQDLNHMGLITFKVPYGTKQVLVRFEDTKLRKISNIVSFVSLLAVFVILVVENQRSKLKTQKYN